MKTILRQKGTSGLLVAQSQVAFNDNATKLVLIGLVQMLLPEDGAAQLVSLIALLLVTPFVLFAPLSGWVSDRFPKRKVLSISLWAQLAIMGILVGATAIHSLALAIGGFFLLGLQSTLMSPARRGMAKELGGESVGELVGWMEMTCIVAILGGSLLGGQMIDGLTVALGSPWMAAGVSFVLLGALCGAALVAFRSVPSQPAATATPFEKKVLLGHVALLSTLRKDKRIWRAAMGDAVFYLVGGVLVLSFAEAGRILFPDGVGAARITGMMLAAIGGGVAVGSVIAARMSRRQISMSLVPIGALGMCAMLAVLATLPIGAAWFFATLLAMGAFGGLFVVPIGAFIVDRAPDRERGKILAASSMLSSIAGIAAVGLHALTTPIGLKGQFLLLALLFLMTAFYSLKLLKQDVLRTVGLFLARQRYSVNVRGEENLPSQGGALIVCNHVTYVDTLILSLASARPIRFLSYDGFFGTPVLGSILRCFGAIPVSSKRAGDAIRRAVEHIQAGELVCIFPEGQLTRTGCVMELKAGFELIARRAACPVVVAHLDGLWGSIFSFEGGRYFTKLPRGLRRRATVSFSRPGFNLTASQARETMFEMSEEAFRNRPCVNLTREIVSSVKKSPTRVAIADRAAFPKPMRAMELYATARVLSRRMHQLPDKRIGVILPPGVAGTVANLALIFSGKTPVNLNPTIPPESARACLERAGISCVVTANAVIGKLRSYPFPEDIIRIDEELKKISSFSLLLAMAEVVMLPWPILKKRLPGAAAKANDEAALLFTSGTSGLPKGVALNHRHLVSNTIQVAETGFLRAGDRLLTPLPLFHCFGLTMGLILPLIARRMLITSPSPLESEKIAETARADSPTILLATPTFLRGYIKRIPRDAFGTLRVAATGAERLPAETCAAFRERFGCDVLQGYGLTETSPVVSFNISNPERGLGASSIQQGWRDGTVGRLVPGIGHRFLDPETGRHEPGATRGILALRGPNVIESYLEGGNDEKFRDGWFVTGDIVSIDEKGFLLIEGRLSRFSKIGGEMVSHSSVETVIADALGASEQPADCVLGRPCAEKGEELVLLTARDVTREELREKLAGRVPNLHIPKHIVRLERLPVLATGKLDLAACKKLAEAQEPRS